MANLKYKIISIALVALIMLTNTGLVSFITPAFAAEQDIEIDTVTDTDIVADTDTDTDTGTDTDIDTDIDTNTEDPLDDSDSIDTQITDTMNNEIISGGKNLGESIFKDVTFLVNGQQVSEDIMIVYQDNMRLELIYHWEIPDEVELESGDWAEIKVPAVFKVPGYLAGILEFDGEDIGTYTLNEDNYLVLVFNDGLKEKEERSGKAGFVLDLVLKDFEDDSVQTIDFGETIDKTFTLGLKPKGEDYVIAKSAKPIEKDQNYIEWIIDVNTTLNLLNDMQIHDTLPPGLALDESSLVVTQLIVGLNGSVTEGGIETDYDLTTLDNGFSLNMGRNNKAYRINYRTLITDTSLLEYKNTAELLDEGDVKNSSDAIVNIISKGSYIEKTGTANDDRNATAITWTIDVNKAQDTLKNVTVKDVLPNGLSVSGETGIKLYALNRDNNDWIVGEELPLSSNDFPLELGDIDGESYRIVFETNIDRDVFIDDKGKLIGSVDFINNVELLADSDEGTQTTVDNASSTVTVVRDSLVSKTGQEVTSYDHKNPVMEWTVVINKAKQNIYHATLKDKVGQGHHIIPDTVKVYDEFDNLVEKKVIMNDNGFSIDFGHIDSTYKVVYRTEIDDRTLTEYNNKAQLEGWLKDAPPTGGPGSGNGPGSGDPGSGEPGLNDSKPILEEFEGTGTHSVQNRYIKQNVWETIQGVDYHGVDYSQKTMSWKITIDAVKEEIAQLKIKDSFVPEKSIKFLPDSFIVTKNGEVVSTGYTVKDLEVDGFEFEFNGSIDRAKYEIYYKTSFASDTVLGANGVLNPTTEYLNEAKFTGSTVGSTNNIDTNSQASYAIESEIFNSGSKRGHLNRENREIEWNILLNLQNRNLTGEPYTVSDTLSYGQEFVEDSFIVYKAYVNKDGKTQLEEEIKSSDYEMIPEKNSFKLVFENGLDYPIVVKYRSSIKGISQAKYTNTANTQGKDGNRTYNASVTYPKHSEFVKKELVNQQGNLVFMDDELNWEVTINESLSEIKNAEFVDKISSGHEFVRGSLKLYKDSISPENEVTIKEDIEKIDGATLLKLKLGDIDSRYILTYDTVVIVDSGKISNTAKLSGDKLEGSPSTTKEFEARKSSWGMGTGKNKGSIKIVKRDKENPNITLQGAGFELWYLLNGEEKQVTYSGKTVFYTDALGTITFTNLSNNRQYIIREVTPPEGYKITENDFLFTAKTGEVGLLDIHNEKDYGSIKIKKIDAKSSVVLSGAKFALYQEDGTLVSEKITDKTGIIKFEGLEYGRYTLKELEAPIGYKLKDEKFVIIIDANKSEHSILVENESTKPVEPENPKPIDPDKPKPDISNPPKNRGGTTVVDKTPEHHGINIDDLNNNPDTGGPQDDEYYLKDKPFKLSTVLIIATTVVLTFFIARKLRSDYLLKK